VLINQANITIKLWFLFLLIKLSGTQGTANVFISHKKGCFHLGKQPLNVIVGFK
jgi:hypothetical protein